LIIEAITPPTKKTTTAIEIVIQSDRSALRVKYGRNKSHTTNETKPKNHIGGFCKNPVRNIPLSLLIINHNDVIRKMATASDMDQCQELHRLLKLSAKAAIAGCKIMQIKTAVIESKIKSTKRNKID